MSGTMFLPMMLNPENNLPDIDLKKIADFDDSQIFQLEKLGEGAFGCVKKAYDKQENKFLAIKFFRDLHKKKNIAQTIQAIMEEDKLLLKVNEIRESNQNYEQHFLQYEGAFKDPKNSNSLILKMESGCATLDDILKAGKKYSCSELLYVIRNLVEGFFILEENRVANRDVKPGNIILVEKPDEQQGFYYKISDFGIGCQLKDGDFMISGKGIVGWTKQFAAPEVLHLLSEKSFSEEYNPFLADVYSLGIVTLKMIDRSWGKKEIKNGLLSNKNKFSGFEPIFDLLNGMLEEDPNKRWNFKRVLKYLKKKRNDPNFISKCPEDEVEYYQKWLMGCKEAKDEKNMDSLDRIYKQHKKLFDAYKVRVTRVKEAKFHMMRACEIVGKMKECGKNNIVDLAKNWEIKEKEVECLLVIYENWDMFIGDSKASIKMIKETLKDIMEFKDDLKNNESKKEEIYRRVKNSEGYLRRVLGEFYEKSDDICDNWKSEKYYLNSLNLLYGI